jgi:hypothetical protein
LKHKNGNAEGLHRRKKTEEKRRRDGVGYLKRSAEKYIGKDEE